MYQSSVFDDVFIEDGELNDADGAEDVPSETKNSALNWKLVADKTSHYFTGTLQMGSRRKEMDLVFDTTSDWLAVEGHNCQDCTGNVFDATKSEFSKKVGTEESERQYNEIVVRGTEWED